MRTESDSMGTIEVPDDVYWGAQTARSLIHFEIVESMSTIDERERNLVIATQPGEHNEIRAVVRDSGIGFDPLDSERMFNAFHTTKTGGLSYPKRGSSPSEC
jgi:signal transduction histidine kinase